jgi:hypothetical protein
MTENEQDRVKNLLQQTLPPVEDQLSGDLWPRMFRRLEEHPAALATPASGWCWTWLDGALAFGILGLIAVFPSAIPLLLYNL